MVCRFQSQRKVSICLAKSFRPQGERTELLTELILPSLSCLQPVSSRHHHRLNATNSLDGVFPVLFFPTVRYQILDQDKSPKVSKQVIKKVTSKTGVTFNETTEDHKVSILFCPVISRIGSDAEVAIASIKGEGLCPPT